MWSDQSHLIEAWRTAAIDLGIGVTAPFAIRDRAGDQLEFVARVHDFGASSGTLVWMMPEPLPAARLPHGVFHFISTLNPDLYATYDRRMFVRVLEGWGWSGRGTPPVWYRGPR